MLERLHAQIPAILCRAMAHRARTDPGTATAQPRLSSNPRRGAPRSRRTEVRRLLRPSLPRRASRLVFGT
jgi:hypothetical protein